jgi:hypothetical protein
MSITDKLLSDIVLDDLHRLVSAKQAEGKELEFKSALELATDCFSEPRRGSPRIAGGRQTPGAAAACPINPGGVAPSVRAGDGCAVRVPGPANGPTPSGLFRFHAASGGHAPPGYSRPTPAGSGGLHANCFCEPRRGSPRIAGGRQTPGAAAACPINPGGVAPSVRAGDGCAVRVPGPANGPTPSGLFRFHAASGGHAPPGYSWPTPAGSNLAGYTTLGNA